MSKVIIDPEKIDSSLLSQARTAKSGIANAKNKAYRVSMPNDEYNWSSVASQIGDCEDATAKYIEWINGINKNYKNIIRNSTDQISRVEILDLDYGELTVN